MNTRLQVEHPVTELVTGVDLVAQQLLIAGGARLPLTQQDVTMQGHAIEARVYAEDPAAGFLPSAGRLALVHDPSGEGIRVDSGVATGDVVGTDYDPMLAKIITYGGDRQEALHRLEAALRRTAYLGVRTNLDYLTGLLTRDEVTTGRLHTHLLDDHPQWAEYSELGDHFIAAAAGVLLLARGQALVETGRGEAGRDPWTRSDGWRLNGRGWTTWQFQAPQRTIVAEVSGPPRAASLVIDGASPELISVAERGARISVSMAGITREFQYAMSDARIWLACDGHTVALRDMDILAAEAAGADAGAAGPVRSPMPGSVIEVCVAPGDEVAEGDALVTVEAMKMEHALVAPVAARVEAVHVRAGDTVALDQELVLLTDQQSGAQ